MDTCISLPMMLIAAHVCGSSTSSGVGNVAFDYSILKGVQVGADSMAGRSRSEAARGLLVHAYRNMRTVT
jgi:hypothetical protein